MLALAALPSQANEGFVAYEPGAVKAAVERGETVLLHYKSTWWPTCARQARVLKKLRASYPEYNKAITFILVDWDTYRDKPVTTDRKIPRRSTFVLIKGGKDVNRLVAATGEAQIKAMLDQALK